MFNKNLLFQMDPIKETSLKMYNINVETDRIKQIKFMVSSSERRISKTIFTSKIRATMIK